MDTAQLTVELNALHKALDTASGPEEYSVLVGFDGFVDEIIDVVHKRDSFDQYQRMETISEVGNRIQRAAGLSTNIELLPKTIKLGGNGPIMANALSSVGVKVSYVGALGYPDIHPVFRELTDRCEEVYSVTEPGHTDALEFRDGKVMLGKLRSLNDVNWNRFVEHIGLDTIKRLFSAADLVATVNWTMTPYMNEIWGHLLDVAPKVNESSAPIFFIDLADPEKRKAEDIAEAMEIIQSFRRNYRVVLGLNRKEATEVAQVLGLELSSAPDTVSLEEITKALAQALDVWCLMVHPTTEAAAVCEGEFASVEGPYTERPNLTTGAGDNFNSGFCVGLLMGLSLRHALLLGKVTSGFYVREMHSPSVAELKAFIETWLQHVGEDF